MLLVVASQHDGTASRFIERAAPGRARRLSPQDLSLAGWSSGLMPPQRGTGKLVADGEVVDAAHIGGVVTRLPCVVESELPHIHPSDRMYVAAEMTAFLLFWLSSLSCPVLNRPTPTCLAGPNLPWEQWCYVATKRGLSVAPPDVDAVIKVTVVGDRCIGGGQAEATAARAVAASVGATLLVVHFAEQPSGTFVSADPWPDLAQPEVAAAVLDYFTAGLWAQHGS
jgi:hypothetical protein